LPEIRAVTNLFSNIFSTVVISRWMGELDDEGLLLVLDGDPDADLEPPEEPSGPPSLGSGSTLRRYK
jgi:hypothetical protein